MKGEFVLRFQDPPSVTCAEALVCSVSFVPSFPFILQVRMSHMTCSKHTGLISNEAVRMLVRFHFTIMQSADCMKEDI